METYPEEARPAVARAYASLGGMPVDEWLGSLMRAHGLKLDCASPQAKVPDEGSTAYLSAMENLLPQPELPAEWAGLVPRLPPPHTHRRTPVDAQAGTWRQEENLQPVKYEAKWQAAQARKRFMPAYARAVRATEDEAEGERLWGGFT